jgi:dihydrofolate reductase / thymidylate synthase
MSKKINVIVSINNDNVIGTNNNLLIHSKDDLRNFYKITTETVNDFKNVCIMGWNTWESLPEKNRPLKNRINIIITANHCVKEDDMTIVFRSYDDAISWCNMNDTGKIFLIGGQSIYNNILISDKIGLIYITEYDYDTPSNLRELKFFPDISCRYEEIYSEEVLLECNVYGKETPQKLNARYKIYQNANDINREEYEYLSLLNKISRLPVSQSRNSEVLSCFGERMVFDLTNGIPLLTSKKMGYKTILRELLWFINGSTDNNKLNDVGVHIWDKNASQEFMTERGLEYSEGDLGPIYGFQWRHFGAEYKDKDSDYNDKGVDQLKYVIDTIKNDPTSRRIIMSAWNPSDLDKMALPPCHVMCQFNVNQVNNTLDCQLYQRSGDMFLGVPFNIASYSLLTYIIAHLTGYKPGKFIHILGNAHIYTSHLSAINKQLRNSTYKFPTLTISNELTNIDNIQESYFTMSNYSSCGRISAKMIS